MTPLTNHRWSVPQTILFATEIPPNEQVFAFALAQAKNAHAKLILFHAYDTLGRLRLRNQRPELLRLRSRRKTEDQTP